MRFRALFRFPGLVVGLSMLAVPLLAPPSWAFDVLMKVEGIPGEVTEEGHKDWIAVEGFSLGASTPFNRRTGDPTGRPNPEPLTILKRFDKATPLLFKALVQGRHFPSVVIDFARPGPEERPFVYFTIELKNAFIVGMKASGNQTPMEQVSFTFHKIRLTDIPQRADGTPGAPVVVECDFARDICQ